MALTEKRIERLLKDGTPGRYRDSGGLYFRIAPGGSTGWLLRVRVNGRRVDRGLGGYPAVSLKEARVVAKTTYGALLQYGTAPSHRSPQPAAPTLSLREATIQAHRTFKQDWRNAVDAGKWLVRMEKHVLATLGSRPVAEVTQEEILDVLEPLHASMPMTARRIRLNLRRVFAWAQARRLRVDNPAGDVLDGALPRRVPRSRHFRAPHYSEVAASISRVRSGSANPPTVWGFEMVAHTASRFNEVRGMRWAELDESWMTWTIPADRSKDFREHRKPVTRQMRSILTAVKEYQTMQGIATDLVICNRQGRPIGAGTVLKLLHWYHIEHSVHGLRSAFRSWALEQGERWDCAETQLSHSLGNAVTAAYIRSDLLSLRAEMMQRWSDYIDAADYWSPGVSRIIEDLAGDGGVNGVAHDRVLLR